jgi:hypothetical protein
MSIENLFFNVLAPHVPHAFPLVLPESPTLPAATYTFVGGTANPTLNTSGLTRYRVEVSCYGNSYSDAVTLRSSVKAALNGYTDPNMVIEWSRSTDFFEHESLQYRCLSEFYVTSVL